MQKVLLFLILFHFTTSVFAQRSPLTTRIPVSLSYTPNDFFFDFMLPFDRDAHTVLFGFGVNRTIFQQRFYPDLAYRFSPDIPIAEKFHLDPYAKLSLNLLKVSTAGIHKWVNPEIGLNIEFGKYRRLGFGVGYMMLNEFWKQDKQHLYSRGFGMTATIYYTYKQ